MLLANRANRFATRLAAMLLALVIAAAAVPAAAQSDEPSRDTAYAGLVGVGAALCTLVYAPLKLTHALTGSVVAGLAWLSTFGNNEAAGTILRSAVGGDYVILPSHLEGKDSLDFRGEAH